MKFVKRFNCDYYCRLNIKLERNYIGGLELFHKGWSRAIDITTSTLLLLVVRGISRTVLGHPLNYIYKIRHKAGHEALECRRVAA